MDPRRVLIVEDHDASRRSLGMIFQSMGYEVSSAATVAEAVPMLAPPPPCILLDLLLPDGSGEAILETIRASGCPARVVVCTGLLDEKRMDEVKALGAAAVLVKPIEIEDVVAVFEGQ